jgi:hypothetical protein
MALHLQFRNDSDSTLPYYTSSCTRILAVQFTQENKNKNKNNYNFESDSHLAKSYVQNFRYE